MITENNILKDTLSIMDEKCKKELFYQTNQTLKKIKRPSYIDFYDLLCDGLLTFVKAKKQFNSDKNVSFRTYFQNALRNNYCRLINKSYKTINETIDIYDMLQDSVDDTDYTDLLFFIENNFSGIEMKYIKCFLIPPEPLLCKNKGNKLLRESIREHLNITIVEEERIRKNIKQLLKAE
jgi:hypothetical protein